MRDLRLALGGITATAPRASRSARSQSASKAFVAEQGAEIDAADERRHADAVVPLPGQQDEAHQIAERVDQGDDLGGQPAARAADGLMLSPPFAPLAFWCAATMVPSIRAYSKSGSSDSRSKRRSKTPARTQRRNRWDTLFQRPNPPGRSDRKSVV